MNRAERYKGVLAYFEKNAPGAETELKYNSPFELLVSVILSAQCTDKRVNLTTPALFSAFPNAEIMAIAGKDQIFEYIKNISYPNNKATHLAGMSKILMEEFNGQVPETMEDLLKLPGVGRKTANVIMSVLYDHPAMAVDTHVFRVSARLGLTLNAKNPLQCEKQLITFIPESLIPKAHHWLILHGRYICLARKPKCDLCELKKYCKFFEKKLSLKLKSNGKKVSKKSDKEKSRKEKGST
ncbi:MAG: endonuclease III [Sphingobacteriaceae bacterium]|nr:endonuclease III [Sphingobacteriaceae bacterium]